MIQGQSDSPPRDSKNYAPQNDYRSYTEENVFQDSKSWNNDRVSHERLSHADVIVRANGGDPSLDSMTDSVGRYQSDAK